MPAENVLIIAVKKPEDKEERFQSSLKELVSLTETVGGTVQNVVVQNRNRIHPALYIGEGKIMELTHVIDELEIDLVISNDELSPVQLRNLINRFGIHVIDRSQLILDIFAWRAKTKEGKLQVELAQLEYMLPRLRGQGAALSRLGGGIGTRGPGETKLETDQRHIRERIHDIKRKLKMVAQQRQQYRKRRNTNDVLQIAVVGYTNAGKSTIFNRITKSNSLEEDQLFATLDPLTRKIQFPSGFQGLITDTVGFLQDLPTTLIAAFRSTLEEVTEADFILHVVDCSHPDQVQHQYTVMKLLEELGVRTIPILTVYNKKDLLGEAFIPLQHPSTIINALQIEDIQQLLHTIEACLKQEWEKFFVKLSPMESKLLYQLEREAIIEEKKYDEHDNTFAILGFMKQNHPLKGILKEK